MKIVHISDWHGRFIFEDPTPLPEADIYVVTGDMLPNMRRWQGPLVERAWQESLCKAIAEEGVFKRIVPSTAPIVCVRGNHDYCDLAPMFEGLNVLHEFKEPGESVVAAGLRIAGMRGIPWISGEWSDEFPRDVLARRAEGLPAADVYLTHFPAKGVLDAVPDGIFDSHVGLEGFAELLLQKTNGHRALHCHGHVHEHGGKFAQNGDLGLLRTSNAATTVNVIEW